LNERGIGVTADAPDIIFHPQFTIEGERHEQINNTVQTIIAPSNRWLPASLAIHPASFDIVGRQCSNGLDKCFTRIVAA
jgi:hypothetical protein